MRTDELDYELPDEAIAQSPIEPRDAARLLVDRGPDTPPDHRFVRDLPSLIRPGDVVVVNDTRVLPARVAITRSTGGTGEVLLLEPASDPDRPGWWEALCRPSRKLPAGVVVRSAAGALRFEMGDDLGEGHRLVRPIPEEGTDLLDALTLAGRIPLPPYITAALTDPERYQTVFAERPASAAAPTAGLHLTPAVLDGIARSGGTVHHVELVVGLDTFRPISVDRVEDHDIHTEAYRVPGPTWSAVQSTRDGGGRVVALGTTAVRALESAARRTPDPSGARAGRTDLFITPGFDFAVVDVMMTNFHLPRSSLLALVQAFVGRRWRDLYATAVTDGYRFLSFGDAMLLTRAGASAPERSGGDAA